MKNKLKNILITGGAGFIGFSLIKELCKSKIKIMTSIVAGLKKTV
tara:strand:- start:2444 stop:2578 length:135 start_codon:yes stop_codon:yes gene_type:complete